MGKSDGILERKHMDIHNLPQQLTENDIKYRDCHDRIFTYLIMMDYDWMYHRIQATIPIENNQYIALEFKYVGNTICDMLVQINNETIAYLYNTDIF